jgi:hypothetical protein
MKPRDASIDWRLVAVWAVLLTLSVFVHAYVELADHAHRITFAHALALEITSHLVLVALLPAIYWLHRRFPLSGGWGNLAVRVMAVVPYSALHTTGMIGLRLLWFVALLREPFSLPLTWGRLFYEFNKDIVTFLMLNAGIIALERLLERKPTARRDRVELDEASAPDGAPTPAAGGVSASPGAAAPPVRRPERFTVRKRGGKEIMIEVGEIDWIEAAGNYAILHVGGETLEIRSSLSRLETELDPARFVRIHKSHVVNIARVVEITPWISGDWRIRLQDGAELNLSRRYRGRFEALAPVKS